MHPDLPKRLPCGFELNAEYLATYWKWRNGVLLIYGSVFALALVAEQFVVKSSVGGDSTVNAHFRAVKRQLKSERKNVNGFALRAARTSLR